MWIKHRGPLHERAFQLTAGSESPRIPLQRAPDMAILVAMTPAEHVSLAEVKNRLSEVVERLEREHGRVVITKHGRPAAVMLSLEDLESLEETLEILSDPELMAAVREADADVAAGRATRLTRREALALAKRR
jgi:antitoxin YefM